MICRKNSPTRLNFNLNTPLIAAAFHDVIFSMWGIDPPKLLISITSEKFLVRDSSRWYEAHGIDRKPRVIGKPGSRFGLWRFLHWNSEWLISVLRIVQTGYDKGCSSESNPSVLPWFSAQGSDYYPPWSQCKHVRLTSFIGCAFFSIYWHLFFLPGQNIGIVFVVPMEQVSQIQLSS